MLKSAPVNLDKAVAATSTTEIASSLTSELANFEEVEAVIRKSVRLAELTKSLQELESQ